MAAQSAYGKDREGHFELGLSFDWSGNAINADHTEPPAEGKGFEPLADVPPARLGFASHMLTPETSPEGTRRWKLEGKLKIIPFRPRRPGE